MDLSSRLLVKLKGQVTSLITDGPASHPFNIYPISTANMHQFPSSTFRSFLRSGHLLHAAGPLTAVRYTDITRDPAPYYSRQTLNYFAHLFCRPKQQLPIQYLCSGLLPRQSSSLSIAKYFEDHEVSTFPQFTAGLRAFRKGQFVHSAQEFSRLCDVVQRINKTRQTLKENSRLLPWGCFSAALFREGAYKRAEEVSREIVNEILLKTESVADQSARFSAFKAFAAIVASSSAFECDVRKLESHIREICDTAADYNGRGSQATRTEGQGTFFPLQIAKLCLNSALGTWKVNFSAHQLRGCICLWELRILMKSLADATTISKDGRKEYNCVPQEVRGFFSDFLDLVESYNDFILEVYMFLGSPLSARHATGKPEKESIRSYLFTVEKLLNDTSAVLERLESQKQTIHFLDSGTISTSETSAREQHESGSYGEENQGIEYIGNVKSENSRRGTFCEAVIEDEYADQVVMGVIQVCKGLGSSLIRLCAQENVNTPLDLATTSVTKDGFEMGQAALKKGLALCKQYAQISCRMAKGGLLASLAASFHRIGEAVISEGLFRSALVEFGASTGLRVEDLTEAAEKLSQSRTRTIPGAIRRVTANEEVHKPRIDDEKLETFAAIGSHLTFVDRFEYASAMLQYSFLLTMWEGREFEANKFRRTAETLCPVLLQTISDAESESMLDCWVFSLLWKPPITVAMCMTATASANV